MLVISSKTITALRGTPRIYEAPFEQIQEQLSGIHPMDSGKKTYDTGKPKLTMPDLSPAGPNEIKDEESDKDSHTNVGSGYNKGTDPQGPANDEIGPGYTKIEPDPYHGSWAFNDPSDPSMQNMFHSNNPDSRRGRYKNLNKVYDNPVMWTKRYPVQ